jgi:hypothetical protein
VGGICGWYGTDVIYIQILVDIPKVRDLLADLGVDGSITLKWILKK